MCQQSGVGQYAGRTEVCFGNAMAESFWSTLKTELYNRRRFATRDEAKKAVAW
ncbi:integrase core domain-containing protein [Corynebacterium sanguinis]|uniref:integrase core domain-containing protein n=1 Tax=Corynebacterium sanguinis TaxID=2594913 RepID=UPI0021AF36F2|nr:integrase core domain-containing protein [Corynebacterium sanguinis]MCT1664642.1 integrase core domain-containing protein [Corynebacterium sanguinis]